MRLFIALELPFPIQEALLQQMNSWKEQGVKGRFCPRQNLHLTLAFLGEQSQEDCNKIEAIIKNVPFPIFELSLTQVGFFGALCYGKIECDPLKNYVLTLRQHLKEAGIAFDSKPFRPHITLIRQAQVPNKMHLSLSPMQFEAKCCTLFLSHLTSNGPIYTSLYQKDPQVPPTL